MVFFAKNELVKVRRLSMKGVALWRWKMNKDFFHKIALFVDFEILGECAFACLSSRPFSFPFPCRARIQLQSWAGAQRDSN